MPFGFFVEVPIDGGGQPGSPPPRPDQGLPGGGIPPLENYPDNGLPEGGHADAAADCHSALAPPPIRTKAGRRMWPGVPIHPERPSIRLRRRGRHRCRREQQGYCAGVHSRRRRALGGDDTSLQPTPT
jgi:hypothetical protein